MIFTEKDIARILGNVDVSIVRLVARVLGRDFLRQADLDILKKHKVDILKLIPKFPSYYQAFVFGRVSAALGDKTTSRITYPEFKEFLSKMGDFVPNNVEMSYYNIAANRTYEYIKGLGESIKKDITVSIAAEELSYLQAQQEAKAKETIREEIEQGVAEKRAVKSISSRIAERMEDWNRDWGRIVETECQNVYSLGRAQYMMQNNPDPRVYFDVFPGACRHCIRLYLTRGVGSQPRVFRLGELMANGTNVGLKSKDWKPVVGTVHPFCFNSPYTKIFTIEGWKNIKDISIGDLVLTHRNRFRPVTDIFVHEKQEDTVCLNIKFKTLDIFGRDKIQQVKKITSNHPVLVNGEWKLAGEIRVGDKLEAKFVECDCGSPIPLVVNNAKQVDVCHTCMMSHKATEQWKDPRLRKIIARKVKKQMKRQYAKMTDEEKRNLTLNARRKVRENHNGNYDFLLNARVKANRTNGRGYTFIEKKLIHFVQRLGVRYEVHKYLPNDGTYLNDVKGYFADVFLPDHGIVIEADGEKWHRHKKEYDNIRDLDIKRVWGYDTIRFSETEIRKYGKEVYGQLKLLLKNHTGKFDGFDVEVVGVERASNYGSSKLLYNFSVYEDESYIADGIVVHNCRCQIRELPEGYVWSEERHRFEAPENYERKVERKGKVHITIGDRKYDV